MRRRRRLRRQSDGPSPPSTETSTRATSRSPPAKAQPRTATRPAGSFSPSRRRADHGIDGDLAEHHPVLPDHVVRRRRAAGRGGRPWPGSSCRRASSWSGDAREPLDAAGADVARHHHPQRRAVDGRQRPAVHRVGQQHLRAAAPCRAGSSRRTGSGGRAARSRRGRGRRRGALRLGPGRGQHLAQRHARPLGVADRLGAPGKLVRDGLDGHHLAAGGCPRTGGWPPPSTRGRRRRSSSDSESGAPPGRRRPAGTTPGPPRERRRGCGRRRARWA